MSQDKNLESISKKLDRLLELIEAAVIVKMWEAGLNQDNIAKALRMGKQNVNAILKGAKRQA